VILSEEQEQAILDIYTKQNRGQLCCAKTVLHSTNVRVVKKVLKKHGVHIRSFEEAASLSNKNRIVYTSKTLDYFDIPSHNMAWILGFLASDGTISSKDNTIKIGLSRKDRDVLEKIKQEINLDEPIKDYTTRTGFDCSSLSWVCEEHKKSLAKWHVVPCKTFKLVPPHNLPKEYWLDYIRGYFDGDGSICLISTTGKKKSTVLRWQVCSATPEILSFILDFFYEEYKVPRVNIQVQKRSDAKSLLYSIQYSTNATRMIYGFLYPENCLYLNRKKSYFDDIMQNS